MSVETDLAALGPAATEAAAALASALGIGAEPGPSYDLWSQPAEHLSALTAKGSHAWTAALAGPLGHCGEVAVILGPSVVAPGEDKVAAALSSCAQALQGACGADRVEGLEPVDAKKLSDARPGQHALAVPLAAGDETVAVLAVFTSSSQVAELPHLDPAPTMSSAQRSIAALGDVEMTVSVELGRTKIAIRDLLNIHNGAVVQLDRAVTTPVDIFVHGTLLARGEVVVVDESFAVRVTELLTGD